MQKHDLLFFRDARGVAVFVVLVMNATLFGEAVIVVVGVLGLDLCGPIELNKKKGSDPFLFYARFIILVAKASYVIVLGDFFFSKPIQVIGWLK
jgi:hypothetical protein